MPFTKPDIQSNAGRVRKFENGLVVWIPYPGIVNGNDTSKLEWWHPLCDVKEVGSLTLSTINEQQLQHAGKGFLTINDGVKLDPFTISLEADSVEQVAAFLLQDLNTDKVLKLGDSGTYQLDGVGAIQIISTNARAATTNLSSTLILDVSVQINQVPGLSSGGNTWEITFFSEYASVSITPTGYVHGCEIWYQNGTVLNTTAPNGVLTSFVLGTGNDSFSGATTPTAEIYNPDYVTATDIRRWFAAVGTVNASNQLVRGNSAVWTFTSGTSTISTATETLANQAKLVAFYVTAVADLPHEEEIEESWRAVNTP